jgi:hypothetical protein
MRYARSVGYALAAAIAVATVLVMVIGLAAEGGGHANRAADRQPGRPWLPSASPPATTAVSRPASPGGKGAGRNGSPTATATPRPPSSGPPSSPAATFIPSQADLQGALLTAAELPGSGYTAQPPGAGIGLGSLNQCPELNAGESGISAQAAASYTGGSAGPDVSETLLQVSRSGAKAMIAAFDQVAQACGRFSLTIHGIAMDIAVSIEGFPATGDQSAALSVVAVLPAFGVAITGDIVAVRHGGTVIVVTNVGLPLKSAVTQAMMARAYAKVAARW